MLFKKEDIYIMIRWFFKSSDITIMVDWALKINYRSIYPDKTHLIYILIMLYSFSHCLCCHCHYLHKVYMRHFCEYFCYCYR